jgi:uncharacterized protein (DUF1015 family)
MSGSARLSPDERWIAYSSNQSGRPEVYVIGDLAAVPYDVVNAEEAQALAAGDPLSFLHVSRSEIDLPAGVDPYAEEVYSAAAARFAELNRTAPLVLEDAPSLYLYRLAMGAHQQTGLAACFSLDEYDRGNGLSLPSVSISRRNADSMLST